MVNSWWTAAPTADKHFMPTLWDGLCIWPFSARHNSPNGDCRRLINRPANATLSYGKRSRGLDLAESPPKGGGEARGSGNRERSERNDVGGGCDHAGQGAAK